MKKKSISYQFFITYLLMFFIVLVIGVMGFVIHSVYKTQLESGFSIDVEQFINDVETKGFEEAFGNQNFRLNDYVAFLDEDYKVTQCYRSPFDVGYQYTDAEFEALVYDEAYVNYYIFSMEPSGYLLLYLESETGLYWGFYLILGVVVLMLVIVLIVFASVTSRKFVRPINRLVGSVEAIAKGDYDQKITLEAGNELDTLFIAINHLSDALRHQVTLREEADLSKKNLILGLSHDVKTPLTNIIGYADLLIRDRLLSEEEQIRNLKIIHTNGLMADKLTKGLFELARFDSDKYFVETQKVDVCELLRRKLIGYIHEFEEKGISYHFDIPEVSVYVIINETQMERVLDNLIQNSLKYNVDRFTLYVGLKVEVDKVTMWVQDDGVGIDSAYAERIFDPLYRVETSRNLALGGSGLGLSISRKIIEKHGGTLTLKDTVPKGCIFVITLPKSQA